ncbi:MAG: DAK2 domain-containing protein [Lachnospiraceae bacterium]|nr:DAK2 domain-containing protein [Lachnospiraceae bacterium]
MALKTIDAKMLSRMFLAGAKNLDNKKEWINELNVFPVPDGDTGTNMTMTIMSAAKEVAAVDMEDMSAVCKAISSGSLRGARGNSGVILSQLFRGFTKSARDKRELNAADICLALDKAVETAYKAVMKPKEGTILTVARGAAEKAGELLEEGRTELDDFIGEVLRYMEEVLAQTPELLPVLKQAGVVDSGGQGLVEVVRGAYEAFQGKEIDFTQATTMATGAGSASKEYGSYKAQAEADIKFGYCTEFIIMLNKTFNIKMEMDFKAYLESIGDSIVVVADDDIVKVHVHTNDPGFAIQRALKYGALSNLKIDNMRLEHQEKLFKMAEKEERKETEEPVMEKKDTAFIAVSIGDGLNEIFKGLGVDYIIEGGQTMNPSTEDMLNAIDKVNADHVIILPNNKNIILAANQAKSLVEDKEIFVIPTKTVPQGITAVINYVPDLTVEENVSVMEEEISRVKTGQVTYAVRDTSIDDKEIKQGDYMGIGDHGILSVGEDKDVVALQMVKEMMDHEAELISIYYGEDVPEAEAEKFGREVGSLYPDCDIELQYGGQPIYYYVISAE